MTIQYLIKIDDNEIINERFNSNYYKIVYDNYIFITGYGRFDTDIKKSYNDIYKLKQHHDLNVMEKAKYDMIITELIIRKINFDEGWYKID
jgi:hypothetical protein